MKPMKPNLMPRPAGAPRSHKEARRIIESKLQSDATFHPSIASNTVPGPDSIAELTRSLKNNVDLIYQFVYNNIDFYPMFGIQKGALGALIDGMGGPWDQCALMVALLRQSGYTANYVFGQIQLTPTQLQNWLGTDTADSNASSNVLGQAQIPHTVNTTGGVWTSTTLSHIWVQVNISGTNYVFDPSFKNYSYKTGINIASASGYSQATLLAQAQSGATITTDSVLNMNRANVRSEMNTYAQSLQNYIALNLPSASLDDILGGKTIVQNTSPLRQTSLPYEAPGDTPTIWTGDIPNNYRVTFQVQFAGINQTFYSDVLIHQRLTITFNGSTPQLNFNGALVQTGNPVSGFNSVSLTNTFNAFPAGSNQQTGSNFINTGNGTYRLSFSWGPAAREAVNYHKMLLTQYRATGAGDGSEPVLGEALGVQWQTYWGLVTRYKDIYARIQNYYPIDYVFGGICGYDGTAPYFDMSVGAISYPDLTGNTWSDDKGYQTFPIYASGVEGQAIRHQYGVGDANTNRVMDGATLNGITIYDANSSNWSAIQSNLTNWPSAPISFMGGIINSGGRAVLPANANVPLDTVTDFGYYVAYSGAAWGTLVGIIYGGDPTSPLSDTETANGNENRAPYPGTGIPEPGSVSNDPIQLWQGNYIYDRSDISVGSGSFPYKLSFSRHYDSQQGATSTPLGLGWTHNFNITALADNDAFQTSNDAGGAFAAGPIIAAYVINDIMTDASTAPLANVVTLALVERWMTELVTNNTVLIKFPSSTEVFVEQPNGSYLPISNNGSTLAINSGAYTYKTKQGQTFVFNTSGQIASWSWPSGAQLTFTYSSGLLSTVTNGLDRTLTLGYTSNQLTSVSDGNGRSVSYGFDSNGDLTSFTDTLSNEITYGYAQPGQLTQIFLPQNPTSAVMTNTFDTLGRVKTQSDAYSNVWTYYLAGSRSEEDDPLGNARVWYFNRYGRTVRYIDQLENETDTTYDGLNRRVQMTLPEGNSIQYTYDSKSNVLSKTWVAKPASGLSNIVNTFTYNPTWNKVATAVDGNNNTTTYGYDPTLGNLLTIQKPQVNGQTPTITFTWNSRGQILTRTDETNIVTQFNYDGTTEKLLSAVSDYGVSPHLNLTNSFGYDAAGNVTSFIDANTNSTAFQFDSERRFTQKTDPSPLSYITQHGYDKNGQRTSTQRSTGGTPAWQLYSFAYYLTGKLESITDPLSYVTTYDFDQLNRLSKLIDAANRATTYGYDARSMVSTITDNSNTVIDTRTYTNNGLLKSHKDGNLNLTQYAPDGFDRLSTRTFADSSYEKYSYDSNNNVLTFQTRKGNTIVRTFDVLNRVATKAPQGEPTVTLTYDLANRLTQASTPTQSGDYASGNFQFNYDSAGRFYKETEPDSSTIVLQLDGNGNTTQITYPTGYFITRLYDQINRLTTVKLNGSTSAALSFGYDHLSRRTQLTYGNGAIVDYGYALNDDMTSLEQIFNGTTNVTFTYGFNQAHQLTSQIVTNATYLWSPTATSTTSYGAPNSLNEYPSVGGSTYSYDENGCLSGEGSVTYTHDTENHFALPSPYSYNYDPLQRLIQSTNGSSTNNRFFYFRGRMIQLSNGTDTLYVFGTRVDEPLIMLSGGTPTYLHHDRVGSIIATTNTSGSVLSTNAYSPFGETAQTPSGFGFAGEWLDALSGLYYFRTRMYAPSIGRFIEPDALRYAAGLNLYTYVQNDPLNFADPSGLMIGPLSTAVTPTVVPGPHTESPVFTPPGVGGGRDGTPSCIPFIMVPHPRPVPIPTPGPNAGSPCQDKGIIKSESDDTGPTPPKPGDKDFIGPVKPPQPPDPTPGQTNADHALAGHSEDFGNMSPEDTAKLIDDIIQNSSEERYDPDTGKTFYRDEATGIVVIINSDGRGTALMPDDPDYFWNAK